MQIVSFVLGLVMMVMFHGPVARVCATVLVVAAVASDTALRIAAASLTKANIRAKSAAEGARRDVASAQAAAQMQD